jgi:polyisoprenoid-binding protein YceI
MTSIHTNRRPTIAPVAAFVLALLVAAGVALARPVAAQDAPATTTPGVLETPAATIDCETAAPAPDTTYAIVSEESAARYRAQEELANVGATEAVGETNAIIGSILFDESGMPLACSRFDVDMRTLQSDSSRRDNYLYGNTLETEQYPLATFILTAVEGLTAPLADGEETTFTLIGNLTVHGVTKLVAWETTAMLDDEQLTGSAVTTFAMPDFEIEPPVVGPVVSLDETVQLEVDIVAAPAA